MNPEVVEEMLAGARFSQILFFKHVNNFCCLRAYGSHWWIYVESLDSEMEFVLFEFRVFVVKFLM